jgi:hypothetical protein
VVATRALVKAAGPVVSAAAAVSRATATAVAVVDVRNARAADHVAVTTTEL